MSAFVRPVLVLLLATFFLMMGVGTLTTTLSLRLAGTELPVIAIGAVMAGYAAGTTVGSLRVFKVILRVGHIRAFSAFASVLSGATLAHGLMIDPWLWFALRMIEGYCMAGIFVCLESWLNGNATLGTRGQILAFYMMCLYGGQGLGQNLLSLDDGRFTLFVLISILVSLALVPVALTRQTPPVLPDIASFGLRRLYEASPLGTLGTLASGLASGALYAMAPVYVRGIGQGAGETGIYMSAAILGGVVLQWPLGRLSDVFDRRLVLVGLFAALAAVSAVIAALPADDLVWLLATAALFGGIVFALYPVSVAHTNDHVGAADLVSASGGLVLAYSVGATVGPFAASATMEAMGAPGLYWFCAAVGAGSVLFGLWRMTVRPPVPADLQAPFKGLPRTTPVVAPLDPRGQPEQPELPLGTPGGGAADSGPRQ